MKIGKKITFYVAFNVLFLVFFLHYHCICLLTTSNMNKLCDKFDCPSKTTFCQKWDGTHRYKVTYLSPSQLGFLITRYYFLFSVKKKYTCRWGNIQWSGLRKNPPPSPTLPIFLPWVNTFVLLNLCSRWKTSIVWKLNVIAALPGLMDGLTTHNSYSIQLGKKVLNKVLQ